MIYEDTHFYYLQITKETVNPCKSAYIHFHGGAGVGWLSGGFATCVAVWFKISHLTRIYIRLKNEIFYAVARN